MIERTVAECTTVQMLSVKAVAELLGCSSRHIYRLADGGKMPPPVRLGALVRWSRQAIEDWIAEGCKPVRTFEKRSEQ